MSGLLRCDCAIEETLTTWLTILERKAPQRGQSLPASGRRRAAILTARSCGPPAMNNQMSHVSLCQMAEANRVYGGPRTESCASSDVGSELRVAGGRITGQNGPVDPTSIDYPAQGFNASRPCDFHYTCRANNNMRRMLRCIPILEGTSDIAPVPVLYRASPVPPILHAHEAHCASRLSGDLQRSKKEAHPKSQK